MTKIAAFFDLDRTLIDVNSALLYAQYEKKKGRISTKMLVETVFTSVLYHFNILNMESAYQKATKFYRNRLESEVEQQTQEFFEECVAHRLQIGARFALDKHESEGHINVLLSTTSSYQGKAACNSWGIPHSLTNEFPTKNGRLIGEFKRPLCYHQGKVARAENWAKKNKVDLSRSYFYSDSLSDVPMLRRVGFPHVVNPDPRLKRLAKKEGWPILDWKTEHNLD